MAQIGLNVIRSVFAVGERVAPGLTGRAAFELFSRTPSPGSMTPGEKRAVTSARDFMAEARKHCLTLKDGRRVTAYEFRPDSLERRGKRAGGTVLVVHGWRSRTEYMKTIITGFVDAGYRVVSLDLPGHGASSGRKLDIALGAESIRLAADWLGPFSAMVAHSFGGAVAINAAAGMISDISPVETGAIVTIASPVRMPDAFTNYGRMMGIGPQSQKALAAYVKRIAGTELEAFNSDRVMAGVPVPTLVIHDEGDKVVPVAEGRLMANAGPHVRMQFTNGLGHKRIIADAGVVNSAIAFVQANRPGKPN